MKTGWVLSLVAVSSLLLSGCGGTSEEEIQEQIDAKVRERAESLVRVTETLNMRISSLEQSNTEMREEVARLRQLTEEKVAEKAEDAVEEKVKEVVVTWLDEKGSGGEAVQELVQTGFENNFTRSMEAYEAKKEAEAEARREQERVEREQRRQEFREQRVARMAEDLQLSDDQAAQLLVAETALHDAMHKTFDAAREEGFDRDQVRESINTLRTTHTAVVREFLTEEQLRGYEERQDRFGGWGGRGGRGR